MALKLWSHKFSTITPKEADSILLSKNTYNGQRPFDRKHIDSLATKMRKGEFLTGNIIFANLPNGNSALVNGQHQLHACVNANESFDAVVYDYHCDTEDDIFKLFSQIDQGKTRSSTDISRACKDTINVSLRNIPHADLMRYGAAIYAAEQAPISFATRTITTLARVATVKAHADDTYFLHRYSKDKLLRKTPVNIAMVTMLRADRGWARKFWDNVTRGNTSHNLDSSCCGRLCELLKDMKQGSISNAVAQEYYNMCLAYWNGYVTGRNADNIRISCTSIVRALKPMLFKSIIS